MAKPFKDPIDDEADLAEGTKRSMADLKELSEAADPDAVVEVPVGEEDEPDPDADLDRELTPREARRRERGGEYYRTIREQRAAAEAKAQAYKEQLDFERSNRQAPAQQVQQSPDQTKALRGEVDRIYQDQTRLLEEYQGKVSAYQRAGQVMPREEYQRYDERAKELDAARIEKLLDLREAQRAPQRMQEEQQRAIVAKAPDVFANQRAADWARGEFSRRVAENPNIDREQLFDEVVEGARRAILGKRPPPDQITRQRATGLSRGSMASSGAQPSSLQMTKGQRVIARAAYPKLSPEKAYQKWANENGRELVEMERESGRRA